MCTRGVHAECARLDTWGGAHARAPERTTPHEHTHTDVHVRTHRVGIRVKHAKNMRSCLNALPTAALRAVLAVGTAAAAAAF